MAQYAVRCGRPSFTAVLHRLLQKAFSRRGSGLSMAGLTIFRSQPSVSVHCRQLALNSDARTVLIFAVSRSMTDSYSVRNCDELFWFQSSVRNPDCERFLVADEPNICELDVIHSYVRILTFSERGAATPKSPRRFSRDCLGTVCDSELTFDMTSLPFKPDTMSFFNFRLGQITDLWRHKRASALSQNATTFHRC